MARAKKVINMLENIRRQVMKMISRRSLWQISGTPYLLQWFFWRKKDVQKKHCSTIRSGFSLYEVNEFDCGYRVDLA